MPTIPPARRRGNVLGLPHYHAVRDRDGDYTIWTYHLERGVRAIIEGAEGTHVPLRILTCRKHPCRIYGDQQPDDLSEEILHARIDTCRNAARCSQGGTVA